MKQFDIKYSGKQRAFQIVFALLIFIIIGASFLDFANRVEKSVHHQAEQTLNEMVSEGALRLDTQIKRDMAFLRTEASIMAADGTVNDMEKVIRNLKLGQDNYKFSRMTFIKPDGTAHTSTGEVGNLSTREYVQSALGGTETVSDIVISNFSGEESFALAVPVYENGNIIGVLSGAYGGDSFSDVVNMKVYGNKSITCIIQPNGTYVLGPKSDQEKTRGWNSDGDTQQEIVDKMTKGESGYASFNNGEQNWQFSYVQANINDWYVVTLVPEQVVMAQSDYIQKMAIVLCAKVILALVAIVIYIIITQRRRLKEEQAQQEKRHLDNSRYRVLLENLEALFFEWDLEANKVTCSKEWKERLGYEPDATIIENGTLVDEQEQLSFSGFIEAVRGGLGYSEEEYQLRGATGKSFWCRIRISGVQNQFGEVRRIMGLIEDIDERKRREASLMNDAMCDPLTNLLNKMATEEQITFVLKNEMRETFYHGFMLLDIDDFKSINDNFGHNRGDQVLKNVANGLLRLCRSSDIVGRIGGDEFVIFMRNVTAESQISMKAKEIVEEFKSIEVEDGTLITCSLGIAVAKGKDCSFEALYNRADKAMYQAKKGGKNQFAFYEE